MIDALVMMLNYDMACFRVSASIAAAVQRAAKQQGPTFQHTRPSVNTFAISASHYASASLSAKRLMTIGGAGLRAAGTSTDITAIVGLRLKLADVLAA